MRRSLLNTLAGCLALQMAVPTVHAYPLDGYGDTGIRRIEAARLAVMGDRPGRRQPPGALLPTEYVDLRLLDHRDMDLPAPDPEFTAGIVSLLGDEKDRYGIAVLDISDPDRPLYAEYRGDYRQNVGSVGKLVVALALFQALADIYPRDQQARIRILRDTVVTADEFIQTDHHKVRIFDPVSGRMEHRHLQIGDQATLWEYLDWMLSPSSNAAASMVMKQAMLMVRFGRDYPPLREEQDRFFNETPKAELSALFERTFQDPLARNGFDLEQLRQGSFFTRTGKIRVPGTTSYGTARQLMLLVLRMEQGRLVDEFSSRQIKRLLYMTERRIRYASSPALADSAVYFKSGSLYACQPEPGYVCGKYKGNKKNYMNSLAIIESPAIQNRLHYMVTLISNVLYKNSAVAHQTLGTRIHRLMEDRHPAPLPAPGALPEEITFGEHLIGYAEQYQARVLAARTQMALLRLGYDIGDVDGVVGSRTRAAIRDFQKKHGLKADGEVSAGLLKMLQARVSELRPATPPLPTPPPGVSVQSDRAPGQ